MMKNCMEHTPAGGKIYCDYGANPLYVWIRIQDDGPGFAAEDLPHLFERFYQGKDAAGGGAGIGLALARSIFELQNGKHNGAQPPGRRAHVLRSAYTVTEMSLSSAMLFTDQQKEVHVFGNSEMRRCP